MLELGDLCKAAFEVFVRETEKERQLAVRERGREEVGPL
jgi:hypothetical protein